MAKSLFLLLLILALALTADVAHNLEYAKSPEQPEMTQQEIDDILEGEEHDEFDQHDGAIELTYDQMVDLMDLEHEHDKDLLKEKFNTFDKDGNGLLQDEEVLDLHHEFERERDTHQEL